MSLPSDPTARIAHLNDVLRTTFLTGKVVITAGIRALNEADQSAIREAVERFDTFDEDNDPYNEHDFGAVTVNGHHVFWKIDCYDPTLQWASDDPADPSITRRVLTIMLADEW